MLLLSSLRSPDKIWCRHVWDDGPLIDTNSKCAISSHGINRNLRNALCDKIINIILYSQNTLIVDFVSKGGVHFYCVCTFTGIFTQKWSTGGLQGYLRIIQHPTSIHRFGDDLGLADVVLVFCWKVSEPFLQTLITRVAGDSAHHSSHSFLFTCQDFECSLFWRDWCWCSMVQGAFVKTSRRVAASIWIMPPATWFALSPPVPPCGLYWSPPGGGPLLAGVTGAGVRLSSGNLGRRDIFHSHFVLQACFQYNSLPRSDFSISFSSKGE